MDEFFSFKELKRELGRIEGIDAKIKFLERYLVFYSDSNLRAHTYDLLGDLLLEKGVFRPDVFVSAASAWESEWLKLVNSKKSRKLLAWRYLRKALDSYRVAYDLYRNKGDHHHLHRINRRIDDVKNQLKKYNPLPKKLCYLSVLGSFILSAMFFSYNFTGFAIADVNNTQSIWLGAMFFLISLTGIAFLVKFWD